MALDAEQVEKIAHLAMLGIDAGDIPEYARNLSDILAFVEQLESVDTASVVPLAHPLDAVQRLRVELGARDEGQRLIIPEVEIWARE